MNKNSPIIIFGSNAKLSSASIARLQHLKEVADESYSGNNDFHESIEPIFTYTTKEIFEALEKYKNRLLAFHFEGRSENYEALLEASNQNGIKNLPARLGGIPQLGYVFLSGCAQDKHINDLLNRGVPAVITSSKRLSNQELSLFAETIHQELGQGKSIEDAYSIAKESIGVVEGQKQRIFINLRGLPKARKWRLQAKIIGDPDLRIVGEPDMQNDPGNNRTNIGNTTSSSGLDDAQDDGSTDDPQNPQSAGSSGSAASTQQDAISPTPATAPPPKRKPVKRTNFTNRPPFVGSRPFSTDDADIFSGRDDEIEKLLTWATEPGESPFLMLTGAAGSGKTSLIQAGLLPQLQILDKPPVVYQLSAANNRWLFGTLHEQLCKDTGIAEPFEAWREIAHRQNQRIILIVDDIGMPLLRPFPGQYAEFPRLLAGLSPIFSDTSLDTPGKILLSVRNQSVHNVSQHCQHYNFRFETFPLKNMDDGNLKQAIRKPFQAGGADQIQITNDVIDAVASEIQRDPLSPGLTYLQEIMLRLWHHVKNLDLETPEIKIEHYKILHANARLLDRFLDAQLNQVKTTLGDRFSTQQLLQFLDFHYDAYHQPLSRSNHERSKRFPHISAVEMRQLLTELTQHRLLTHSDASGNANEKIQIGHLTLAAHANARLIAEKAEKMTPARKWNYLSDEEADCGSYNPQSSSCQPPCSQTYSYPAPSQPVPSCHSPTSSAPDSESDDCGAAAETPSSCASDQPTVTYQSSINYQSTIPYPGGTSIVRYPLPPNHPPIHRSYKAADSHASWDKTILLLLQLALMFAILMAILLFAIVIVDLTIDRHTNTNPYVIKMESTVKVNDP